MKIKLLVLGTVVTTFALTSFAAGPSLSPRANGNQIKIVISPVETPKTKITYVDFTSELRSPRAQGNQIVVAKAVYNDMNSALVCQKNMLGSPKLVTECSSHSTMPGCLMVASTK